MTIAIICVENGKPGICVPKLVNAFITDQVNGEMLYLLALKILKCCDYWPKNSEA